MDWLSEWWQAEVVDGYKAIEGDGPQEKSLIGLAALAALACSVRRERKAKPAGQPGCTEKI